MSKVIVLEKPFNLKPYSRKELAGIMQISEYILKKWAEKIDKDDKTKISKYNY